MRNVYEVYIQYLSCKEQTPRLSFETHAKFLPVYSVASGCTVWVLGTHLCCAEAGQSKQRPRGQAHGSQTQALELGNSGVREVQVIPGLFFFPYIPFCFH